MAQADLVDKAGTKMEVETLSKEFGIKGRSILSDIDSFSFPQLFPIDFMHVVWENVMKTLITLWTGDYKGLDEGSHNTESTRQPGRRLVPMVQLQARQSL